MVLEKRSGVQPIVLLQQIKKSFQCFRIYLSDIMNVIVSLSYSLLSVIFSSLCHILLFEVDILFCAVISYFFHFFSISLILISLFFLFLFLHHDSAFFFSILLYNPLTNFLLSLLLPFHFDLLQSSFLQVIHIV